MQRLREELFCRGVEFFFLSGEECFIFLQILADTDETVHLPMAHQVGNLPIQGLRERTGLENVRKDERRLHLASDFPALLEIESDIQGINIRIIGIVD